MAKFETVLQSLKKFSTAVKERAICGYRWIGADGLLNMETSALLMILFITFFPLAWAIVFTFIAAAAKCAYDKYKGHINEKHDLICACVGIIVGGLLGAVHIASITLF